MTLSVSGLLVKFRRHNTPFGVTRETVKAMAVHFDVSETEVVHMALARMAKNELPSYEADEGPLSSADMKALAGIARAALPKGKIVKTRNLF